jgi:putative tryptophan/tyrosine transport system substrate-binding protein
MDRRAFIATATALLAAPLATDAQTTGKVYRVGVIKGAVAFDPERNADDKGFVEGLREAGFVVGQNVVIEWRSAYGQFERFSTSAVELVRIPVDLIYGGSTPGALAALNATSSIPILTISAAPVESGLGASLARPGGNVTGIAVMTPELAAKRLELLKAVVPRLTRVAAVHGGPATFPVIKFWLAAMETAAATLGLKMDVEELDHPDKWDLALAALRRAGVGGVTLIEGPRHQAWAPQIAAHALKHRMPTVYAYREGVEGGYLMSYGPHVPDLERQVGRMAGRILQGARPQDLPFEQPRHVYLVINLKTAKALGLTIPPAVLARADELIE